jgi:DNA processing protein
MNWKNFLLRLKLTPGVDYLSMLQIVAKLAAFDTISAEKIWQADLPPSLKKKACQALRASGLATKIARIEAECSVITFFDAAFPERLRQCYRPPLLLFARGDTSLLTKHVTVIAGTRKPTGYSKQLLDQIIPWLVDQDIVVATGLARGVESWASRLVLQKGGQPLVVVGNGLNYIYPAENRNLQKEVAQKGLVLSEYLPDTPPQPFRFPERDRVLAGLSENVIVTEAGERSGSLITANLALQENRNIFAVPGPIFSKSSRGTNQLIAAGATPLVDLSFSL